jgi:tetratricopeptide (TPR) repeat protein
MNKRYAAAVIAVVAAVCGVVWLLFALKTTDAQRRSLVSLNERLRAEDGRLRADAKRADEEAAAERAARVRVEDLQVTIAKQLADLKTEVDIQRTAAQADRAEVVRLRKLLRESEAVSARPDAGIAQALAAAQERCAQTEKRMTRNEARYRYNLGVVLARHGEREAAEESFQESVRLDPTDADARYNLALLAKDGGDDAQALVHVDAYLKGLPAGTRDRAAEDLKRTLLRAEAGL